MIKYILVRHVESEGNVRKSFNGVIESPLTSRGKAMKTKLVETLWSMHQTEPFDLILSSPTERAHCVASAISEKTGVSIEVHEALKEFNFGIFEGLTAKEAESRYPAEWQNWMADYDGYSIPTGESGNAYHRKIRQFFADHQAEYDGKTIVVIAHGGTIHSIMMTLLGLPLSDKWHFNIALGSITKLRDIDGFGILDSMMIPEYDEREKNNDV